MLVAVLLHGSLIAQTQPQSPVQTPAKMQQVLHKAQEKDKAVVILNKKIDKQKTRTLRTRFVATCYCLLTVLPKSRW